MDTHMKYITPVEVVLGCATKVVAAKSICLTDHPVA